MIRARAAITMIAHRVTQIANGTRFRCMFPPKSRRSEPPVVYRPFGGRVERKLNMSCLYSTACVYGVTALTVAIWSIPLLFVVIWRLTKASIGIRDLVFLGLLGLIFLIQVVSSLISPNATMGLIYILAGAAK